METKANQTAAAAQGAEVATPAQSQVIDAIVAKHGPVINAAISAGLTVKPIVGDGVINLFTYNSAKEKEQGKGTRTLFVLSKSDLKHNSSSVQLELLEKGYNVSDLFVEEKFDAIAQEQSDRIKKALAAMAKK